MKDATLCYIERDGKFLMLLRNKKKNDPNDGKWIGVGGKREQGESPEECAVREIFEETGLTAVRLVHWGDVYFNSDIWEGEIMRLFLVPEFSGELRKNCDEGELHWIDRNSVFDLNLWDGDRIFLRYMLSGKRFETMKLTYTGERLSGCSVDGETVELLDVYDEEGRPAGYVASRDYVHWRGLWHTTVHIWVVGKGSDGNPSLMLQLRAANRRLYPSCWDTSSAGHLPAGEDALSGAVRELGEELGMSVSPDELEYIGTTKITYDDDEDGGYHDREHCRIYILRSQADISTMNLQASEVEQVMIMSYDDIIKAVTDGSLRNCLHMNELEYLRRFI